MLGVGLLCVFSEGRALLMRLIRWVLIVIALSASLSCAPAQRQTSVVIRQGEPQQFIISGNGLLDIFDVSGPVRRCEASSDQERLPEWEKYWEIAPLKDFDVSRFAELGPLVYGKVPAGFRPVTPASGEPPPICEGGPYSVSLHIRNGSGVNMLFIVREGKIVTEEDED